MFGARIPVSATDIGDRACGPVSEIISLEQGQIQGRQALGRDH